MDGARAPFFTSGVVNNLGLRYTTCIDRGNKEVHDVQ
jgi:hypothetical protein